MLPSTTQDEIQPMMYIYATHLQCDDCNPILYFNVNSNYSACKFQTTICSDFLVIHFGISIPVQIPIINLGILYSEKKRRKKMRMVESMLLGIGIMELINI